MSTGYTLFSFAPPPLLAPGEVIEIRAGDTIHTPPGEWHWHGSAPEQFMTHLAIWEAPAAGPESEWGDQVTDEEYLAAATRPTR